MKDQRWPGDYQTIPQEFKSSRQEEEIGMRDYNASLKNDYLTSDKRGIDAYERGELEPSWATQMDVVGMQPHAREYLEYELNNARSERKFEMIEGQMIDHSPGIHFNGYP